jgi:26S proteasome regulatory subunit N2
LYDNGTQEFLAQVIKSLPNKVAEAPAEGAERQFDRLRLFD